jgi:integrase/recombinase XerD
MNQQALTSPQSMIPRAARIVAYLSPQEVRQMADAVEGRQRERDRLLILTMFQTGLRVSEALSITPRKLQTYEGHAVLYIRGKGNKDRMVACPNNLAHQLKSYAFDKELGLDDRIFPIKRVMAWLIVKRAAEKAGVQKGAYPHILRHSDAIERLRQTGNPKALQLHLGHESPLMTMRYLSTLTAEDALRIQQQVEFE